MKKTAVIVLMLALLLGVSGCGKKPPQYTNLADESSRAQVAALLESGGLSAPLVGSVLDWAREFTEISQSYTFPEGFTALPEDGMDYSSLLLDDTAAPYAYLQWLNCRLTAFSLLKDRISTAGTGSDADLWLMFDIEAIDTVPELRMTAEERTNFITLFNQVDLSGASTLEEHEEKIREAWAAREVLIDSGASLVCVYLHAPRDNVRFVGHTGVLVETGKGLLFVEKYSNLDPFQATTFPDREALKEYLLSRSDLYGDGTELAPILTENGSIL